MAKSTKGKTPEPEMDEVGVKEYVGFRLPDEKVFIRFIKRQTGFVTNPKHVAYGGKLEGAVDILPAKKDRNYNFVEVLTKEEELGLESIMGVSPGYLSVHKAKENFWEDQTIKLSKEGLYLDLSIPMEYIKYKMLLAYTDYISPSIMETPLKKSYKYEIVRDKDINTKEMTSVDYNRAAYRLFGKIESSREQLAGVIRVLGNKSVATTDHDWLIKEVGKLVEADPKRFVETLNDPNYKTKLFIEQGISSKNIVRNRGLYSTKDGVDLCEDGETPTLMNAIKFLNNIKNQEIKLAIEAGF